MGKEKVREDGKIETLGTSASSSLSGTLAGPRWSPDHHPGQSLLSLPELSSVDLIS